MALPCCWSPACQSVASAGTRLAQLDEVVNRSPPRTGRRRALTMEMEIRTRDNAVKTGRVLMAGGDADAVKSLKDEMAANTQVEQRGAGAARKAAGLDRKTGAARGGCGSARTLRASRARKVTELAADPKTQAEALNLFRTETAGLLEQYLDAVPQARPSSQRADFEQAGRDSDATYRERAQYDLAASLAALIARNRCSRSRWRAASSRPLGNAVAVAEAIKRRPSRQSDRRRRRGRNRPSC